VIYNKVMTRITSIFSPTVEPRISLDEYLKNDPEYQNISSDEIAKELGYFTQVQRHLGFPYHPYKPKEPGSRRKAISDMEALERLKAGKAIELQPMRDVVLNLSPSQLQGIASMTTPLSALANVVETAANANLSVQTLTHEAKNGAPIFIPNSAYLKLLYQLQSADFPDKPAGEVSNAAKDLSYFTAKAKLTNHPWSFHSPQRKISTVLKEAAKGFLKQGWKGAVAGVIVGALIGGPIGALLGIHLSGILSTVVWGAKIGFGAGSLLGVKGPLFSHNGEEYDELTALGHLLKNEPVNFQQEEVHTFNIPFLGNFSWKTEYGKPSKISNPSELAIFSKMESATGPTQTQTSNNST
jgi:hypothetical protein